MDRLTIHERTAAVKRAALQCGFDAVGIARAEPLDQEHERYTAWLAEGMHASMAYMARNVDVRKDVSLIVEGARSVIVVARNYYTPHAHPPDAQGKVSRYAWGTDYHEILPAMLDDVIAEIARIDPEARSRRYVDTGPVHEKQWAVRAGLGWQGKHSNILRRDIGSWFFLGVVITTMELAADEPMPDHCGTCTACIDACPTQAIVQPGVVDAKRCLSTWTIETKPDVEFPAEIAQNMDGWLFGCDTCQDVCPWNRFQTPSSEPLFEPRDGVTVLPFEEVVSLQPSAFAERFRKSPIKRSKLAGLQRNARTLHDTSTT